VGKWARIKDDVYVSSSSPGGNTEDKTAVYTVVTGRELYLHRHVYVGTAKLCKI